MESVITLPIEGEALIEQAVFWPERARALRVVDQVTNERACEHLMGIKALRAEVESTFGPITKRCYDAWKEVLAQRKRVEDPLTEAEGILKRSIGAYRDEQERLRRVEEARLREEGERWQAEVIEAQIVEAEKNGATVEEVKAIAEQPVIATAVYVAPAPKVEGISTRENWKAEVTDKAALIRAAATNPQLQALLEVNMTALNGMARSLKSAFSVPGARAVRETIVSAKRG